MRGRGAAAEMTTDSTAPSGFPTSAPPSRLAVGLLEQAATSASSTTWQTVANLRAGVPRGWVGFVADVVFVMAVVSPWQLLRAMAMPMEKERLRSLASRV